MTALYELVFAGWGGERSPPLRYGGKRPEAAFGSELGYLKLGYKDPGGDISRLLSWALDKGGVLGSLGAADPDFRFAAAVAGFAEQYGIYDCGSAVATLGAASPACQRSSL